MTAVIVADGTSHRWAIARSGPVDRLLVRWRTPALDAQLAAGRPAEHDRHRAVRAGMLVDPASRGALAGHWEELLARAARPPRPSDARVPLVRPRILAADADIRRMIAALRASAPVPARGVAIASRLLTDGTGPLYNVKSAMDLRALVRSAIRQLDPAAAVTP